MSQVIGDEKELRDEGKLEELKKERDTHFYKLLDIETICQAEDKQEDPIIQKILSILYVSEDGFTTPAHTPPESEEQ